MSVPIRMYSYNISKKSPYYPGRVVNIERWFTEKYNFDNRAREIVKIEKISDLAILMTFYSGVNNNRFWVPKSIFRIVNRKNQTLDFYKGGAKNEND